MSLMNKPLVVDKLHKYQKAVRKNNNQIGKIPRSLAFDYNNICNFKCDFCYEAGETRYNKEHLKIEDISRIGDEAHELGIWEVVLQGGELLINIPVLLEIVKAFKPERFQMILVTNGFFLTKEVAVLLRDAGIDCVGVSISSLESEEFDKTRHVNGAHKKALEALLNAKEAGLTVWAQPIFGHHNSHSQELSTFLEWLKERNIGCYFLLAMPYGIYKDNYLDGEDMKIFNEIRKKYDASFDTWDFYDKNKEKITGCWALNRCFITPLGDVLPCPFINVKVGNVKQQSLKEILDYGFKIKYFSGYSPVCLAGQNRKFREKYLQSEESMFNPPAAAEVFEESDFIER